MRNKIILLAVALAASFSARATTLSISDFSNLDDGNAFFSGSWADPASGGAATGLSQGAGYYTISGVTASTSDGVSYYFGGGTTVIDVTAYGLLSLTAKLGAGNTAQQLIIDLLDPSGTSEQAIFTLSSFNSTSFTTVTSVISPGSPPAINAYGFDIIGGPGNGSSTLDISLDQLSAVSAVPEPSTWAAILGTTALLGVAISRRRRRRLLRA